jgi:hypothetical protein
MDADREERLRRRARWLRLTGVAGPALAVAGHLLNSRLWHVGEPAYLLIVLPLTVLAACVGIAALIAARRTQRRILDGRQGERWPLGEPYRLQWQAAGSNRRHGGELHVGEEDLSFLPVAGGSPLTIYVVDVTSVRVRRAGIDVVDASGPLTLFPASYADRERLLWELAVRCPDAMERGMDEAASPPAHPAPPAPAPSASEERSRGPSGLALGSALAGPADQGNPAPPRKSGLGVGLFVPPPGQRGDREM